MHEGTRCGDLGRLLAAQVLESLPAFPAYLSVSEL